MARTRIRDVAAGTSFVRQCAAWTTWLFLMIGASNPQKSGASLTKRLAVSPPSSRPSACGLNYSVNEMLFRPAYEPGLAEGEFEPGDNGEAHRLIVGDMTKPTLRILAWKRTHETGVAHLLQ
jgi:hypothetical protein